MTKCLEFITFCHIFALVIEQTSASGERFIHSIFTFAPQI